MIRNYDENALLIYCSIGQVIRLDFTLLWVEHWSLSKSSASLMVNAMHLLVFSHANPGPRVGLAMTDLKSRILCRKRTKLFKALNGNDEGAAILKLINVKKRRSTKSLWSFDSLNSTIDHVPSKTDAHKWRLFITSYLTLVFNWYCCLCCSDGLESALRQCGYHYCCLGIARRVQLLNMRARLFHPIRDNGPPATRDSSYVVWKLNRRCDHHTVNGE